MVNCNRCNRDIDKPGCECKGFKTTNDFGEYRLVKYKKNQNYVCNKCENTNINPKKTFSKEKHIKQHLENKHKR